jgi:S1-C subfamily serine protease
MILDRQLKRLTYLIFAVATLTLYNASGAQAQKTFETGRADKAEGLYETAREVTTQILYRRPGQQDIAVGSGVWISRKDGYAATCLHVIKAIPDGSEIVVGIGLGYLYWPSLSITGGRGGIPAKLVAKDDGTDVAILQTEPNAFSVPISGLAPANVNVDVSVKISPADEADDVPKIGDALTISGYPLDGESFILQNGNFAGFREMTFASPDTPGLKRAHFLVSMVANPGNSGGPVLNSQGKLVGLAEGNLLALITDQSGKAIMVNRLKYDATGHVIKDGTGQPVHDEPVSGELLQGPISPLIALLK